MTIRSILLAAVLALALQAQDFSNIAVEKVAAGHKFTEGPVWTQEGYLLFSDIPDNKIMKLTPGEGVTTFRENSGGANGNTIDEKGRLYTCESRGRRVIRTDRRGKIEVLADKYEGKRFNAPNDIVVSKGGHVYFTDPAFGEQADRRELDFFGVYQIDNKGKLALIAKPAGRPNGITLSPDGKMLYVANSDERLVRAYDVARDGTVSGERTFVSGVDGVPDGIRTDEKGNLYVTAKGLEVYSPDAKKLTSITIPETPTNCAFGDPDLMTLYITARTSVYRIRLGVKGAVLH